MEGLQAEQERVTRFYRWATIQAAQEVETGYPLLSNLRNPYAFGLFLTLNRMPYEEQNKLVQLGVRRAHPVAVALTDEQLDQQESLLLQERYTPLFVSRQPFTLDEFNRKFLDVGTNSSPLSHRTLMSATIEALTNLFRAKPTRRYAGGCIFRTSISDWIIETNVATGSRSVREISFRHTIWRRDYTRSSLYGDVEVPPTRIACHGWTSAGLILGFSEHRWLATRQEDVGTISNEISYSCSYLYKALPSLLSGLNIDD
jgi:hypothetical protein